MMIGLVQPEDVADGAVRRAIHLLEVELLHPRLVGRDGRAFDGDADPLGRLRRVDRDLVAGLVALLHAEVEIQELDVEIGMDQLVLDELPDDAGHLVAVHLDDRILHLDFRHSGRAFARADVCGEAGRDASGARLMARPAPSCKDKT